ncbi:DUF6461 domain-containing protein [Actinokineospora sp. PR83]|uniref:DUF6461 domain-containing protein n=1 Tax=Actinokineospora sp. PR83 TaxID=2884908 RepID=UPI001F308B61|nr:DUF6461 domain-containing protein [Actinokineospora sp. PR83]MCG8916478.1 DUF6461 domain-containing protein [Actinokineospora sp. PR83]
MSVPEQLIASVAEALPLVSARIPDAPAAELGRFRLLDRDHPYQTPVQAAHDALGPLLASRLLGVLELTVAELRVAAPGGLTAGLAPLTSGAFGLMSFGHEPATRKPLALVEAVNPGATALVVDLARALARESEVRRLLAVGAEVVGEEEIIAQHGRAHLALAVVTAGAVLREVGADPVAVVATALGVAALLLHDAGAPPSYAAAALDKRRADYRLPLSASVHAVATGGHFALVEHGVAADPDFAENGLVAPIPGGVAVRTGVEAGQVQVGLDVLAEPPSEVDLAVWDEVVEVSWTAEAGFATLTGGPQDCRTPPWSGPYRVRVHARGRDGDDVEGHHLVVWSAPAAPPIVHKRTDRLGHRLRGEPEPPVVTAPDAAFRWVHQGRLSVAATITSVTGLTPDEVVLAFGADPGVPLSWEECQNGVEWVPAVAVRQCGDVVVAVEVNGFRGSDEAVLRELSRAGRAASMFWNAKAVTCLSFARGGEVLWAEELLDELPTSQAPEVRRALPGLDFDDYRHLEAKGVAAVARFTGGGPTERDLERLLHDDVAFRTP